VKSRKSTSWQVMMVARGLKWIFSTLFLIPVQGNFRLEVIRGQIVRIGGSSSRREHLQCWRFFSPQGFRAAVGHTTSGRIDAFVNTLVRLVVHKCARFYQQRHRLRALRQAPHDVVTWAGIRAKCRAIAAAEIATCARPRTSPPSSVCRSR